MPGSAGFDGEPGDAGTVVRLPLCVPQPRRKPPSGISLLTIAVVIPALTIPTATATSASATTDSALASSARAAATPAASVKLRVQSARTAGTRIAYASIGTGHPLLLLNGTGSPMAEWDPAFLAGLSRSRRVIVFDYPGLGRSGHAPGRITMTSMAHWTASLIKTLKLGRPDVLGWSMGGFVTQRLAEHHPTLVRRQVLAATNLGGTHTTLGPQWAQDADSDPNAGIATYFKTNYPRTACGRAAGTAFVERLARAVNSGDYPDESVPDRTYDAMVRAEDPWLRSNSNYRELRHVKHHTLVTTGTDDVITPPANTLQIARTLPNASTILYATAGHSFLFQQPVLVATDVLAFLTNPKPQRSTVTKRTNCTRS